jgi:hypothetical protein
MSIQAHATITSSMAKLVDMKVWIDSTSVTGQGCVLVAPKGQVFKSNLGHEIVVQVEKQEQSIKRTIAIWKAIDAILASASTCVYTNWANVTQAFKFLQNFF